MKAFRAIALLTFFCITFAEAEAEQKSDQASAVYRSFDTLKTAMRLGDGNTAASHVTPETLALYERGRKLALDSSSTDFESVPQVVVMLVFQLRWMLDKQSLEKMDGEGVFSWGVKNGLVSKTTLDAFELDDVQVDGVHAMATLRQNGQLVGDAVLKFRFHEDAWKVDFVQLMMQVERAFDAIREKSGKSKMEVAIYLLERTYRQEIPAQILKGPLR